MHKALSVGTMPPEKRYFPMVEADAQKPVSKPSGPSEDIIPADSEECKHSVQKMYNYDLTDANIASLCNKGYNIDKSNNNQYFDFYWRQ